MPFCPFNNSILKVTCKRRINTLYGLINDLDWIAIIKNLWDLLTIICTIISNSCCLSSWYLQSRIVSFERNVNTHFYLTMSSSNQINDYEVPSIVERDNNYTGLDLVKREQDDDVYDDVPPPVNTISRPSIQPMVMKEPVKKQIGKLRLSFHMQNPFKNAVLNLQKSL